MTNYALTKGLGFWHHFNWELYVKVLEVKMRPEVIEKEKELMSVKKQENGKYNGNIK